MRDPITPAPIKPDDELMLIESIDAIPSVIAEEMSYGGGDDDGE